MAKQVILENRTKRPPRMLVLNLDVAVSSVRLETRTVVEGKDGKRRVKVGTKSVPDSVRIPAHGETAPLPEKILKCREVKAAIDAREIRVKDHKEAPPAPPEPPKSKPRKASKSAEKSNN